MKIFTPRELQNKNSLFAFGTMSTVYWDFAVLMESKANEEFNSEYQPIRSFYVFPTIIFLSASFEALINEGLAKLLLYNPSKKDDIEKIKSGDDDYRNISKRIKASAILLDRKGNGDIEENILQEYTSLTELRNAIVHYNPYFGGIFHWSSKLISAFERSKVKAIEGDWTETFRRKEILEWAKDNSKNMIGCFLDFQLMNRKEFFGE
jgi:hypothetical protein